MPVGRRQGEAGHGHDPPPHDDTYRPPGPAPHCRTVRSNGPVPEPDHLPGFGTRVRAHGHARRPMPPLRCTAP
ncbi:hypothetical protein ACFPN0_30530 [Kitasatospora cinereorecta]